MQENSVAPPNLRVSGFYLTASFAASMDGA